MQIGTFNLRRDPSREGASAGWKMIKRGTEVGCWVSFRRPFRPKNNPKGTKPATGRTFHLHVGSGTKAKAVGGPFDW
ncbi:MAG: hypothetical protein ACTS4V_00655 [Candidatus Hodgkinia cicadicola]